MCNPISTLHPDLLISKGIHEGYEWEVTANRLGYRCGYVRIPAGHPWHGKDYDTIEPYPDVHGGLTFAEPDIDCRKGGEDSAWWLGFDCAHLGDAPDPSLPGYTAHLSFRGDTIKGTPYVEAQCKFLAEQAKAAAAAHPRPAGEDVTMSEIITDGTTIILPCPASIMLGNTVANCSKPAGHDGSHSVTIEWFIK